MNRLNTVLENKINNDDLEGSCAKKIAYKNMLNNLFQTDINSFINNIIGDSVDCVSETITRISTYQNKNHDFQVDRQLSTNRIDSTLLDTEKQTLPSSNIKIGNTDLIEQHQYSNVAVKEQSS